MPDIDRKPAEGGAYHNVHVHLCPECDREFSCNCKVNADKRPLVCRDCEHENYDPIIHGGPHRNATGIPDWKRK